MIDRDVHEANRLSWNAATRAHNSHKGDQARFLREGGSTLFPEERALLGEVDGLDLVHLQCNAGQDTLSLARLGARVTGVDISDEAIDFARQLSADSGLPGTFERADVYDWLAETARGTRLFDVAFSSYGALCWLSDLAAWARGVHGVLRPGGRVVVLEFHPVFSMMGEDGWRLSYTYSSAWKAGRPDVGQGVGDYVAGFFRARGETPPGEQDFANPHPDYVWNWGVADKVQALIDAGFRLEVLREYPYSTYAVGPEMREVAPGRWVPPEGVPPLPMMLGFVARRD